jgi:chemotaxis protein CheX
MMVTEETFYTIIQDTWASTLEFQIDYLDLEEFTVAEALTVSVRISGAWCGELHLQCPLPLARLIAVAIFQVEAAKAGDEEMLDALGELIHIVGGNLKALLPQPVTVSLPSRPESTDRNHLAAHRRKACRLALKSKGYPFAVTLFERLDADGAEPVPVDQEKFQPTGKS